MWVQFLDLEEPPRGGNGNPLRYSCLENLIDGEAWCRLQSMDCKESDTTERLHFHFQELAPVAKPSSGRYLIKHIVSSEETGCGLSFWSQFRAYPLPTTDQPGHYEKSHHVSSHIRPWSSDRLLPLSERFKVKMHKLAWAPVIGVVLCQNDYKMRGAFLILTPN